MPEAVLGALEGQRGAPCGLWDLVTPTFSPVESSGLCVLSLGDRVIPPFPPGRTPRTNTIISLLMQTWIN